MTGLGTPIGSDATVQQTAALAAPPAASPAAIRARVESLLRTHRVPGASIAVVDRDGLCWADGFGLADVRSERAADSATVYHLFSGTKLFTATAVMQLAERGVVSLDDPVSRHLPVAARFGTVTLRHLLSHRSGLKESLRGLLAATFPGERVPTADEALAGFPLVAARPPGRHVEYRNVNYALLGAVIGRVTGMEYREYVTRFVIAPLGADLSFSLTSAQRPRAATGYMDRWDPMRLVLRALHPSVARRVYGPRVGSLVELRDYDLATAAIGGLVGAVPEFAKFLRAQLMDGASILGADAAREMQAMVGAGAAGIMSREGVGLGWKIGRVGERTFLNHEGGGAGFTSELRLYPSDGIGIAIGMNAMRMPRTMRLAHELSELVRG